MNTKISLETPENNDELSLWDIVNFLKESWRWLAGGLIAGLIGAVGFIVISPTQYEASAVIQPATVGLPTTATTTTTTKGAEVEPVAQTLERLKLATFYTEDLLKACQVTNRQKLAAALKATLVKGNALIQLSYRAPSVAVAEACMNAVVQKMTQSQVAIAIPIVETLKENLKLTQRRLSEVEAFQAQLEKRTAASTDGTSLIMLNALSKREEIARLQKLVVDQKVQMSPPITQPMQLLEPIYVPDRAVFPKLLPVLVGGLFSGLVLGGLVFFVRRSWLARKAG